MPHPASPALPIDVLVLSPHYDDAVLSCGGALHQWSSRGSIRAGVVTVCGAPPDSDELSDYACSLHTRWAGETVPRLGDGSGLDRTAADAAVHAARETVTLRRKEDAAALDRLATLRIVLDVPDAIYRRDPDSGAWLYEGDDAIFGRLSPAEWPLIEAMSRQFLSLPGVHAHTQVLAPMTIGGHVDHQLVRRAAEWTWPTDRLRFYEDYPYAGDDAALQSRVSESDWYASLTPLSPDDLAAKIEAIACYESQISTFWSDERHMAQEITAFAASRGSSSHPAERTWGRHQT